MLNVALGSAAALVVYFLGWWSRGPRARQLDEAYDQGAADARGELVTQDVFWSGESGGRTAETSGLATMPDVTAGPEHFNRRRAILLEPGPTRYPALMELAQDAMSEPESHPDASDSTFVRKLLIEWEQRYPIPVGAP